MRVLLLLALLMFACAPSAMANIPPAPQAFAGLISLQLSIVLFSLVGGAYSILHRQKPSKIFGWIWRILVSVLMIMIFSVPEVSFIIALVYGYVAIKRSINMISWSRNCKTGLLPALQGANSVRLIFSGVGLLLSASLSLSLIFVFYQPWSGRYNDDQSLLRLLKKKLSFGMEHKHANGQSFYNRDEDAYFNSPRFKFIYGKDDETFTILVLPDKLPAWPYNLLVSMPSLRADQTGQIRLILVHNNFEECPPDAPVVHIVDKQEVSDLYTPANIRRHHDWMEGKPVW